jgi:hypothetical protein
MDLRVLLIENGYPDNVALFSHLIESHNDIIKSIQDMEEIKSNHRQKLRTAVHFSKMLLNARGDRDTLLQIAIDLQCDPKVELLKISNELREAEQQYPFLKQVREEFRQEQEQERNQINVWRKKVGLPAERQRRGDKSN